MKKLYLILFATTSLLFSLISFGYSAENSVEGKIVFVDYKLHAFMLETPFGLKTYVPNDNSHFELDGKTVTFWELEKGEYVTVTSNQALTEKELIYQTKTTFDRTEQEVRGKILTVDKNSRTFEVLSNNELLTFHADPASRFYIDGELKPLADLKIGQVIDIKYREDIQKLVLKIVDVAQS